MKKIGVIELNTISVKLTIAEVLDNQSYCIAEEVVEPIKVASDLETDGLVKPARVQELIQKLKAFKAICNAGEITETVAVASPEYIEAKNQRSVLEELHAASGFRFRILSTEEQLTGIYIAIINSLDIPKGLIINISGTSVEILNYNRRNLLNQHTFNFGAISLAEKFASSSNKPEEICEKIVNYVFNEVKKLDFLKALDVETQVIGVGEIFLSIGKLSRKLKKYPYDKEHNYVLSNSDFDDVYNFVKMLDIDKTKKLKGISSSRADMLSSGLCIVKSIASLLENFTLVISKNSLSEGLLFTQSCPITLEKPITDMLGFSMEKINTYYNNSLIKNTNHVYSLAMILFKQLKVLHKLPRTYVKVLRVASNMFDCGKRINVRDFNKLGLDVVLGSEIYGVTHREQVLAGFVVACQNLDDFSMTEWVKYKDLFVEEDLEAIRKLGIIVKLASSLDRFNKNRVVDISCDILGDSVIMKTIVESPAEMEITEGLKIEVNFAKAFKKHLEIL